MNLITKLTLIVSCQSLLAETHDYDLVIYGGTSAGVTTAVQAKKMGKTAIIVGPDKHLGGLSSGGLGWTDTGKKQVIGGLSREFYHRVFKHYDKQESWNWQPKEQYGNKGQGNRASDGEERTMWIFEPSVAEQIFEDFVKEYEIPVRRDEWLDREKGVKLKDGNIVSITMLSGKTYTGRMFIDATYEGDLMASAGVDYHVGRESKDKYGEKWNGVQTGTLHHRHHFGAVKKKISPYKTAGDPKSGVLPRISDKHPGEYGAADKGVQAYCFRMCLTNHPENRIPFPKPEGYDASQYQLLTRIFDAGWRETFHKFDPIPNYKTDTNNHGPMSTDNIGYNHDYPDASYERRKEIIKEHETYQKGWLYFIANDPSVPKDVQKEMQTWGLPKDEFKDNGNWSHQLYIREARRMMGSYVMTENELMKRRPTPQSVGMGSYAMDSHNIQRYITPEGYVQNEGDIGTHLKAPYEIAYGSLIPKKGQCGNLLVPVCVSSSHIAFGSIRMEPVFMILGQSAATAAVMAIDKKIDVQDVPYEELKAQLIKDGQVLDASMAINKGQSAVEIKNLPGIVVDDSKAKFTGIWNQSSANQGYLGVGYQHDGDLRNGRLTATFTATIPKDGKYEVRVNAPPNKNRASNAKAIIQHADGTSTAKANLRNPAKDGKNFHSLGTFNFKKGPATVILSNEGANGYLIADAIQWLPVK
ncbi:FAD-dependent oxidoreductase [Akkermansiaceae bacterium]|nr:FAD-dependent oxidoreductase [Akkermansiaceae bacterium]